LAFTEPERVKIRRYMGWAPGITEPTYDAQITRIQSVADGGIMSTSDTESEVRSVLDDIATIESRLRNFWDQMEAGKVDELAIDSARATGMLRSEARRLVRNLGTLLDATPLRDAFTGTIR